MTDWPAIPLHCVYLTRAVVAASIAFAVSSGSGTMRIAMMRFAVFGQILDHAATLGLGMIISAIAVIQLVWNTATH